MKRLLLIAMSVCLVSCSGGDDGGTAGGSGEIDWVEDALTDIEDSVPSPKAEVNYSPPKFDVPDMPEFPEIDVPESIDIDIPEVDIDVPDLQAIIEENQYEGK